MSAVEEYRDQRDRWVQGTGRVRTFHGDPLAMVDDADAALAELEAENATVIKRAADAILAHERRAEQTEAALEEREAQLNYLEGTFPVLHPAMRCASCGWYRPSPPKRPTGGWDCEHDPLPGIDSGPPPADWCCKWWTARAAKEEK